ncbi:hypothetical protein VPNG_02174 [Cytospora leucostoma]|uniref:Cyanovirin-N domain-containing protein n=1 Tax=Cytospora leucostoma TaxID=1230097 RepID=A0A423XH95_9PEZI|nr:hypothetical protein VPNG_02174 [Cytospora leucostoma]
MFRQAISIALLAGAVLAADFGQTCKNETFDSTTNVLTAICNAGDGEGTVDTTSIDLNKCFGYADGALYFAEDGNFGESCEGCSVNILPDPIYYRALGTTRPWLNCTCQGTDASINMDVTEMSNKYGTLTC